MKITWNSNFGDYKSVVKLLIVTPTFRWEIES